MSVVSETSRGGSFARWGVGAAALVAALLGCEAAADDGALLRDLSRDQFMSLCDEIRDATAEAPVSCADGWSATVLAPTNSSCNERYLDDCAATAGDMRACAEASRRDPCAAADAVPPECAPFYASACMPWVTASPVVGECPRADPVELAALDGIYEIIRHTSRTSSCVPGGDSVLELDAERLVVVLSTENFSGEPIGLLESCADLEACRTVAARLREEESLASAGDILLGFVDQAALSVAVGCPEGAPTVFAGRAQSYPSSDEGCPLIDTKTVVSRPEGGTLHIDSETWESSRGSDPNSCFSAAGDRRALAGTCTHAEWREARFVQAL